MRAKRYTGGRWQRYGRVARALRTYLGLDRVDERLAVIEDAGNGYDGTATEFLREQVEGIRNRLDAHEGEPVTKAHGFLPAWW